LVLTLILGIASTGCSLAGLAAWIGYSRNAGSAIRAVTFGTHAEAHRLAAVTEWCSVAQMILGFLAIALTWYIRSRANISVPAKWVSGAGFVVGALVLLLTLFLV
jgi:hypothetical protein